MNNYIFEIISWMVVGICIYLIYLRVKQSWSKSKSLGKSKIQEIKEMVQVIPDVTPIKDIAIDPIIPNPVIVQKTVEIVKEYKLSGIEDIKRCSVPESHNFPSLENNAKCVWCGRELQDVNYEYVMGGG